MPLGPGKYDEACTEARKATDGSVLLIVFDGNRGSGFSAQITADMVRRIPAVLRKVADEMEQQFQEGRV